MIFIDPLTTKSSPLAAGQQFEMDYLLLSLSLLVLSIVDQTDSIRPTTGKQ